MKTLRIATWGVFAADVLVVMAWLSIGLFVSESSLERDTTAGLALLAALPLAGLFLILFFSSSRGSTAGLWICLVLGLVPLILITDIVVEQHF